MLKNINYMDYIIQFGLQTVGFTILFLALSIILYLIYSKTIFQSLKKSTSLKALFIALHVIIGIIIGFPSGIHIGFSNVSNHAINQLGDLIIKQAVDTASQNLSIVSKDQKIDIKQANAIIDEMAKVKLMDDNKLEGMILNKTLDMVRQPFINQIKKYFSGFSPESEVVMSAAVAVVWKNIYTDIDKINTGYIATTLGIAIFSLLGLTLIPWFLLFFLARYNKKEPV